MDFKRIISNLLAAFVIVVRRLIYLIFTPYKTMRKISLSTDVYEMIVLFGIAFFYFLIAGYLRGQNPLNGLLTFFVFIIQFFATVLFFYLITRRFQKSVKLDSFIYTIGYSLIPTLIWFISNLLLFIILPPPRTMSILGKGFSVFFIAYSLSLLVWKLILLYFSLRFSSRLGLYRIVYVFSLYIAIILPISVLLYYFRIFRVPFI